jgi:molybdate transport system regulatory protein
MNHKKIDAVLALKGDGRLLVGRDRIAILEAVAEHGSITRAAKSLGFSYKAAWDALTAVNNLLPRPAFLTQAGGRQGGGAHITEDGRRLITAFRRLEEKLTRISAAIAEDGVDELPDLLFWSVAMKTSARNAFRCRVTDVIPGEVNVEVLLHLSASNRLVAVITHDSVDDLGIVPGRETMALVKSSFVLLASAEDPPRTSARNRILGTVAERIDGRVNSEITLDIGEGKTLTSVVTRDSAEELGLGVGDKACALFKASHVILAVD